MIAGVAIWASVNFLLWLLCCLACTSSEIGMPWTPWPSYHYWMFTIFVVTNIGLASAAFVTLNDD